MSGSHHQELQRVRFYADYTDPYWPTLRISQIKFRNKAITEGEGPYSCGKHTSSPLLYEKHGSINMWSNKKATQLILPVRNETISRTLTCLKGTSLHQTRGSGLWNGRAGAPYVLLPLRKHLKIFWERKKKKITETEQCHLHQFYNIPQLWHCLNDTKEESQMNN